MPAAPKQQNRSQDNQMSARSSNAGEAMGDTGELLLLRQAHQEEIQRLSLIYAERVRSVEARRLEVEEECESLGDQLAELRERLRNTEQREAERQAEAKRSAARLEERVSGLEGERETLVCHSRDLSASLARLQDELSDRERSLSAIEGELAEARIRCEEREKALGAALRRQTVLEQERQAMDTRLSELTAYVEAEREKLRRQTKALTTSLQMLTEVEIRLAAASVERLEAEESLLRLETEVRQLARELTAERAERSRAQARIDELNAAAASNADRLRELEEESGSLCRERDKLRKVIETQSSAMGKLQKDLDSERSSRARDKSDIASLREQLREQTERHAAADAAYSEQLTALRKKLERSRAAYQRADRQHRAVRNSAAYRLGVALSRSVRSWSGFLSLPGTLWAIYKDARHGAEPSTDIDKDLACLEAELREIHATGGLGVAEQWLRENIAFGGPYQQASALVLLAKLIRRELPHESIRLAREALDLDPRPFRRKLLAFLLHDAGHIVEAYELLSSIPNEPLKPAERVKYERVAGDYRLLAATPSLPERRECDYRPIEGRVLYVAASARPHNVSGYTVRTHSILRAMLAGGWDVHCITRPGYPWDRKDVADGDCELVVEIEGVRYESIAGADRRQLPSDEYIVVAADLIEKQAREMRPALVHAASNHENALPALLAARRLGVPFIYEVRGLWEYSRASRLPGWEQSDAFRLAEQLETYVAKNADAVLVITQGLADELAERGVDPKLITVVPNGVDLDGDDETAMLAGGEARRKLGLQDSDFVVGYVGSLVAYEGIDDLITAFAKLVEKFDNARLVIVGGGEAHLALRKQADGMNLSDRVLFTGKLDPEEARSIYGALDVVVNPRKAVKVCQLVSPLKPLEAMRYGVPLIVSDAKALREMVKDGVNALVHEAGNPDSLALCMIRMAQDAVLRERLAGEARKDVRERSWKKIVKNIQDQYLRLGIKACEDRANIVQAPEDVFIPPLDVPATRNSLTEEEKRALDERLRHALERGGVPGVDALIESQSVGHSPRFRAFCEIKGAQILLSRGHIDRALKLAEAALGRDSSPGTLRGCLRIHSDAANIGRAIELVKRFEREIAEIGTSDKRLINEVKGRWKLVEWAKMPQHHRSIPCVKGRVVNILAFSLPFTSVGYATRSHGLAYAIKSLGWDIRPYTRPGFPVDHKPELADESLPASSEIDGLIYRHHLSPNRKQVDEVTYLTDCISYYETVFENEQPEIVHAASNFVTALPALIAARRLGIPFVYEVRGFWEVTRSSRDADFVNTPKHRYMKLFEGILLEESDHLLTITSPMREVIVSRGVAPEDVSVAFNSVDPERFVPRERNGFLADRLGIPTNVPVIGYIGSFVDYEGLDDLVEASAMLKRRGFDFRLLLVGDGAELEAISSQVKATGIEDIAIITGRVPHDEVENYYSLIDIAPFPRKPWEVCELVSPLKPFEAMALEKAVVVSGTRALLEVVGDGGGISYQKGSVEDLCATLERVLVDSEFRSSLGRSARDRILKERSWRAAAEGCLSAYLYAVKRTSSVGMYHELSAM